VATDCQAGQELARSSSKEMSYGWIGVDLDGTLAHYPPGAGSVIGAPIQPMVARVKRWLADGKTVKIMTARVSQSDGSDDLSNTIKAIQSWCLQYIGQSLPVTCSKDYSMLELWDDRARQVDFNMGTPTCGDNN
jgi:hypothetical protein